MEERDERTQLRCIALLRLMTNERTSDTSMYSSNELPIAFDVLTCTQARHRVRHTMILNKLGGRWNMKKSKINLTTRKFHTAYSKKRRKEDRMIGLQTLK
jgi:hypothetical protein